MKKYSILFLSTFFLISSLHASQPQGHFANTSLTSKILAPLVPSRATQPPLGKTMWQSSLAAACSSAASTPGATTLTPSLESSATPSNKPVQVSASSSSTEKPNVELNDLMGGIITPAALDNWLNGTDQTVLKALRNFEAEAAKSNPPKFLGTKTLESQQRILSCVTNLLAKRKPEDILEFMKFVGKYKISIDKRPRQELRKFLNEYENQQEKNLLEDHDNKVEQLKASYDQQKNSMQVTEAARHLTYQSDSDNEEEIRVYIPKEKLMAYKTEEIVKKMKQQKK